MIGYVQEFRYYFQPTPDQIILQSLIVPPAKREKIKNRENDETTFCSIERQLFHPVLILHTFN